MPEQAPEPHSPTPIPWSPAALHQEIYPVHNDEADRHTAYTSARWHIGRRYDIRDAAIVCELRQRDV